MNEIRKRIRSRIKKFIRTTGIRSRFDSLSNNRWYFHGTRFFLLFLVTLLALMLTPGLRSYDPFFDIHLGSVAERDVIAPFDFPVYKSETELEREYREAQARVKPVLEFLPGVKDAVLKEVLAFFEKLKTVHDDSTIIAEMTGWEEYIKERNSNQEKFAIKPIVLHSLYKVDSLLSLSDEEIIYLFDPVRSGVLRSRLKDFVVSKLRDGIVSNEALENLEIKEVELRREGQEQVIMTSELTTVAEVIKQATEVLVDPKYQEVSKNLFIQAVRRFIRPNIIFNRAETERLRQLALETVKITRDEPVLKGEKLIGMGERVTPEKIERLDNLRAELKKRELLAGKRKQVKREFGMAFIYFILFLIIGLYVFFHRHDDIYKRLPKLLIVAISLSLVLAFSGFIIGRQDIPNYLIPAGLASMLIAYLLDDQIAIVSSFCLAMVLGVQANFSIYIVILSLAGGIAGAVSVRRISSRRAQYLPILYIGISYLLVLFAIDYSYRGEDFSNVLSAAGWCGINATFSTFATIPLLPLFEYVFKITSTFTLLELSDLNRPLLKRLALEAPGTYHHSIIIGSLAEAAAAGIEANPVYARVAGYYHDIGKIKQPQYFIENQSGKKNPHNKLSPKMSCLVIANHVKEGVELARRARLPKSIIDIIRQHHGNQSISFFFSKEREQNPDTTLVEEDFRYPGPKPQTKEAAIIMLADIVESASRTLSDPTVSRIRNLIKGLIEAKLRDGQLDNTDLTLKDLTKIGEEFLTILIGVHHNRIDYPQSAGKPQDAKAQSAKSGADSGKNGQDEDRRAV